MILGRLILPPRLDTVVPVAQGLPVALIPEELLISTVRNNVVDVRCLHVPTFLYALHTQRVRLKVLLPGLLPSSTITSTRSRPYLFRVHRLVTVTILLS